MRRKSTGDSSCRLCSLGNKQTTLDNKQTKHGNKQTTIPNNKRITPDKTKFSLPLRQTSKQVQDWLGSDGDPNGDAYSKVVGRKFVDDWIYVIQKQPHDI